MMIIMSDGAAGVGADDAGSAVMMRTTNKYFLLSYRYFKLISP